MSTFAKFSLVVALVYTGMSCLGIVSGATGFWFYNVTRSERPNTFWAVIAFQVVVAGLFALLAIYGLLAEMFQTNDF